MPLKLNQEESPSINLTSMIDVLFLLIIFFMVGTQFADSNNSIQVQLPKVANGGSMLPALQGKVVAVKADGSVHFEGSPISLSELETKLRAATENYPDLRVELDADGNCSHQMVCEVMATIQKSGNSQINMRYANQTAAGGRNTMSR